MCAVSFVTDVMRTIPMDTWTVPLYDEATRILEEARAFDIALGLPDCEKPDVAELLRQIQERLTRIEERLP